MSSTKVCDDFGNEIIETLSGYKIVSGSVWKSLCDIDKGLTPNKKHKWIYNESKEILFLKEQGAIFINDAFIPLWNKTERLIFLDGGYGSSKTTYACTRLVLKCLENKYFRCFYGREEKTRARELQKDIIAVIKRLGVEDQFDYSEKPTGTTQIYCKKNGNSFEMFGCDDPETLKGWSMPTDILIDEVNQISWENFGMMFTRLRGQGYLTQLHACFNNCDVYPGHWLLDVIYTDVEESSGDDEELSDEDKLLLEALNESGIIRHHSTYLDNKFQNAEQYYYSLVIKAKKNQLLIQAYCNGDWGIKLNGQPYYKDFNRTEHIGNCEYDPKLPLHITFDENSNPYFPFLICQIKKTEIFVVDEVIGINPNNKLSWVCREIIKRYDGHEAGMYIYGDATSVKEDVKIEKGKNLFTIAKDYLKQFNPTIRKRAANPNNKIRQDFINEVYAEEFDMIRILISPKCKKTIADMLNVEENPDGSKGGKNKKKEKIDGIAGVQRWGHCGDALEYLLCEAFHSSMIKFQKKGGNYDVTGGEREVMNSIEMVEKVVVEDDEPLIVPYVRKSRNGYD